MALSSMEILSLARTEFIVGFDVRFNELQLKTLPVEIFSRKMMVCLLPLSVQLFISLTPGIAFTCEYRAIFGISKAPEGIVPDQAFKWFGEGRNYLCAAGPNGTLYWIFDMKNEEKTQGKSIPRYTEKDIDQAVALYRGDVIKDGVTFGDLFDNRIRASMVPVEEGILKNCFYKRIVLLGDSWHKVGYIGTYRKIPS